MIWEANNLYVLGIFRRTTLWGMLITMLFSVTMKINNIKSNTKYYFLYIDLLH